VYLLYKLQNNFQMSKVRHPNIVDTIDEVIKSGIDRNLAHLSADKVISGRKLLIGDREVIHFGNCNYLGLEHHPDIIESSIQAIREQGIRLTMSRTYVSSGMYDELESLLNPLFGGYTLVAPSSTMLHLSTIPVLMGREDMILLDQQAHYSMIQAVQYLQHRGVASRTVRHNRYDLLEAFIQRYQNKYQKIWYVLDGIYSMYGDTPDLKALYALLDKYPSLHLYIDDAHGTSWAGKYGRGNVLSKVDLHPRVVVTASLGKGFGVIGGVMISSEKELVRKVRNCGNTLMFSAPLSSGLLGASIASARLHFTQELVDLQKDLKEKIAYANLLAKDYHLPLVAQSDSPIFYVAMGQPKIAFNMADRLLQDGFLVNIGTFPAVSMKCSGVRFLITTHLTFQDIANLMERIHYHLKYVFQEEKSTFEELANSFNKPSFEALAKHHALPLLPTNKPTLTLSTHRSIDEIKDQNWSPYMDQLGCNRSSQSLYEQVFNNNLEQENNWDFYYIQIKDQNDKMVLSTYFTKALWKEDILSPPSVSQEIETVRKDHDAYYMTTSTLVMGCQATEGMPLYIDDKHPLAEEAIHLLVQKLWNLQEKLKVNNIIFRDIYENQNTLLSKNLSDKGFLKTALPNVNYVDNMSPLSENAFRQTLGRRSRNHFGQNITRHIKNFAIVPITSSENELLLDHLYQLYLNVKNVNFGINTFTLPKSFFKAMIDSEEFDVIALYIKDAQGNQKALPVSCLFGKKNEEDFLGLYMGLNYHYLHSHSLYRMSLYQFIKRGTTLGYSTISLGFSSDIEKRKLGAKQKSAYLYYQTKDDFHQIVLNNMEVRRVEVHY